VIDSILILLHGILDFLVFVINVIQTSVVFLVQLLVEWIGLMTIIAYLLIQMWNFLLWKMEVYLQLIVKIGDILILLVPNINLLFDLFVFSFNSILQAI